MGTVHRFHGFVRPIPAEHLPTTGVVFRYPDEAERAALQERNLLPFKVANDRAEQICRASPPLHEPRQYRIGPAPHPVAMTVLDVIACLIVAAAIGAMLALGSM